MAKLRKRGGAFQADFFDKAGKRVRKSFTDKQEAILELEKTGKAWTDETNLRPDSLHDDTLVPVMTKIPRSLLYRLRVESSIREMEMQDLIRKALEIELSKGQPWPPDE